MQRIARLCTGASMGRELFRSEDEMGQILVTQRGGRRVLSFGTGLEQSSVLIERPAYLTHEYTQIMLLSLLFVEVRHVTLLGLGGGGLVHCLSHFYPQYQLQVVELRQQVIEVARNWFELPQTEQITLHCGDAARYIARAPDARTDLILSDLYESDGMSEVQASGFYIRHCARHLTEQGVMVLNFHQLPAAQSELMQAINEQFAEVFVCDVFSGNFVMFCLKMPLQKSLSALLPEAKSLAKHLEMPLLYYFRQLRRFEERAV
ncbi:MAG TPA: methyltransferase [Gammaproteobacteria bacterium]